MRRLAWLIWLLVLAPPAQAQEFSTTVSPESVVHGKDTRVTWRIKVQTAGQPVTLRLRLSSQPYSPEQHGTPYFRAGRLVEGEVRLEGPGTLRGGQSLVSDPCYAFTRPLPVYDLPFRHGYDEDGLSYELDVPASSSTVVVMPLEIGRHAPYPGTTYDLVATVDDKMIDTPKATAAAPFGVPLSISTDPPATSDICGTAPRIEHGRPVRISGRTDPALAGDRVELVRSGPEGAKPIGEAVVQPDGWFVLDRWFPEVGEHVFAARYPSQRSDRTDDFSHPQWLGVDPAPPPAPPAVELVGRPPVRGRIVTPRLHCRSETADSCKGVVRLVRKGRRLAAGRFVIAPTAHMRVRLRLPRSFAARLRRHGRLAARVVVRLDGGEPVPHRVTLRHR